MDKIQQALNFKNSDGEVITFLHGHITLSQLILIIVLVIGVVFVIKLLKGLVRKVVLVVSLCVWLCANGILSPTDLKDISGTIAKNGVEYYNKYVTATKNIKVNGDDISVKLGSSWVNVSDIDSVISSSDSTLTILVNGVTYLTDDEKVIDFINQFK